MLDRAIFAYLLAQMIKITPNFLGKKILVQYWRDRRNRIKSSQHTRSLPGGEQIACDLSIPYEFMIFSKQEEEQDLSTVRKLLKPNQTFVDCGANIGLWTLTAISAVSSKGKVFAFEPNPSTFEKLSRNASLSKFKNNISLFPSAVGKESTRLLLQCRREHNKSKIVSSSNQDTISIPIVRLDDSTGSVEISGMKIDVEGFELDALLGAEKILKTYRPWLCIEFNSNFTESKTLAEWDVHQYLAKLGYTARHFKYALDKSDENALPDTWQLDKAYANLYYSQA
jgi:FkbM family methyltransferase